ERPFVGTTYEDLMLAHTSGFPKGLRHHREEVPRGLAQVVSLAMARDPKRRFPTVRAFREAFLAAAGLAERAAEQPGAAVGRSSRRSTPDPRTETKAGEPEGGRGGLFGRW